MIKATITAIWQVWVDCSVYTIYYSLLNENKLQLVQHASISLHIDE